MPLPIYTSAAFTNSAGVAVAANASVEVRDQSNGSLVPIFEDSAGEDQITQPGFQADLDGRFQFYASPDAEGWEITVTAGEVTHTLSGQFPQGGAEIGLASAVTAAANVDEAISFVGRGAIVEIADITSSGYWIREDGWAFEWMRVSVDLDTTDSQSFDTVLPFDVNRRFTWWSSRFAAGAVSDSGAGREAMASAVVLTGTASLVFRLTSAIGPKDKELDLYVAGYLA